MGDIEVEDGPLMPGGAATIVTDCNWLYDNFGAKKHGAARAHYAGSVVDVLGAIPVARWCKKNALLFHWATWPKLDCAIDVMRAWGFSLVTGFPWVKTVPSSAELAQGIGFWSFVPSEILLIGRRGAAKAPNYQDMANKPIGLLTGDRGVNAVFYARRGPHSRKPLSLIEWMEAYLPGPYVELFATGKRPGWTCVGKETGWWLSERGCTPYVGQDEEAAT